MVDKVKPLKIEDLISGGEEDLAPTESNPAEDYLTAKGISFENSDNRLLDLDALGQIQYKDDVRGVYRALNNISNFSFHKIVEDKTVEIESNQHMITTSVEVDGFLNIDGGLVFL